jgi:hypothetical protein
VGDGANGCTRYLNAYQRCSGANGAICGVGFPACPGGQTCQDVFVCNDSPAFGTSFPCAKIGCTPQYRDWATLFGGNVFYATGDSIVPDSTYHVSRIAATCGGVPGAASCSQASTPPTTITTPRWGNVNGDPVTNAQDVAAVVDKVRDASGAVIKPRGMLQPVSINPFNPVSAIDLAQAVDGARGLRYPFQITHCP